MPSTTIVTCHELNILLKRRRTWQNSILFLDKSIKTRLIMSKYKIGMLLKHLEMRHFKTPLWFTL